MRAEGFYRNALGAFKNICKKGKTASQIYPTLVPRNVPVKKEKLDYVKKLPIAHYGEDWDLLAELNNFKNVFEKTDGNIIQTEETSCEPEVELPTLIV